MRSFTVARTVGSLTFASSTFPFNCFPIKGNMHSNPVHSTVNLDASIELVPVGETTSVHGWLGKRFH